MFTLIMTTMLALMGLGSYLKLRSYTKPEPNEDKPNGVQFSWALAAGMSSALGLLILLLGIVSMADAWKSQVNDIETARMYTAKEVIYENKANLLTAEFTHLLAEKYPEHELAVYKSLAPEQVNLYLVKYPELRSSATILSLADRISELENDKYNQEILKQETLKSIRARSRDPWILFVFLLPKEPANL